MHPNRKTELTGGVPQKVATANGTAPLPAGGGRVTQHPDMFSRVIAAGLVLTMLGALAGGVWFFRMQQHAMRAEAEKDLTAIARSKADQIRLWRKDQLADAAMYADPFICQSAARFLSAPTENNRRDLRARLHSIARQHDYADVLLVAPDGATRFNLSEPADVHQGYLSVLDTVLGKRRPVFVELHSEGGARTPHISVVTPLFRTEGDVQKTLGALVLITDASQFLFPLIQSWPVPSRTAETLLVRRDGDHVLFLNDLRHQTGTALNLRVSLDQADLPAVMAVKGKQGFVRGRDYRGVDVAAVLWPIVDSPWFMVSKIDAEEAFSDWHDRSLLLLVMILGWTGLAGTVALVFWQRAKKIHFRALYRSEADLRAQMERHSVTLKAVGDAVIATDDRGRVELLNPVAEALTGWRQAEAAGKALEEVFQIVNARTREAVRNPVAKVLAEGRVLGLANHTVLIARDGAEYQIADSAAPITDTAGRISGVVLVFRDVTGDYAMQQALRNAEHYYRSLIHALHEDILVIDRDYRVTDINNGALKTLGLDREAVIGRCCYEVSHGLDAPCHKHGGKCGLYRVLETKTSCNMYHEHVDAAGNRRHVDILMSPLKDESGRITHVIEAVRDVTDLFESRKAAAQSESWYRQLFERSANAVFLLDTHTGRYRDANAAGLRLVGRSLVELKTLSINDVTSQAPENRLSAMGEDATRLSEVVYVRPDGSRRVALFSMVPLEKGKAFGIAVDITERKQAEKALQESEEKFRKLVDQAADMLIVCDVRGGILDVNQASVSGYGYSREALLSMNVADLDPAPTGAGPSGRFRNGIGLNAPCRFEAVQKRKDGSLFPVEMSLTKLMIKQRPVVMGLCRDISDRKIAENEKERFQARLQQAQKLEAIGALAGGIAHDFNNILFPIIGMSEMLLEDVPSGSPEQNNLREILTAGKRGSELVRQILAFSRRSEGKKTPVRVQQVLKEVIKLVRASIPVSINISHRMDADCGLVMADPTQVHQVAMNLITNAYHAVDATNGNISIHLKETLLAPENLAGREIEAGPYALLTVADNGCGIASENLNKIFEPYFTTKAQGKGTGIGLSTVYGIVREHGGDIQVYSELEKGTTVNVYWPLMVKVPAVAAKEEAEGIPTGKERILLVDDEAAIVRLEKQLLERLGYRTTAHVGSREALEAFRAAPEGYDLVITDMTMPHLTGDRLSMELVKIRPDIPVIICTGFSDRIDAESAEQIGIKGFLMKPVARAEMAALVRKVLDGPKDPG